MKKLYQFKFRYTLIFILYVLVVYLILTGDYYYDVLKYSKGHYPFEFQRNEDELLLIIAIAFIVFYSFIIMDRIFNTNIKLRKELNELRKVNLELEKFNKQ